MFDNFLKIKNVTYEQIQWEVDNFISLLIGSYLADRSLSRKKERTSSSYELKLREIRKMLHE